jgi:hypothetical protein
MSLNRYRHFLIPLAWVSGIFLSSCKDATVENTSTPEIPLSLPATQPTDALSLRVEALTGAHTKAVWSHHIGTNTPDPFCNGASHQLQGLDTQDSKGVRIILSQKSNYSRPLITPDGQSILYTRKIVTRPKEKEDTKVFDMTIMITDWQGTTPKELTVGYALDIWRDPTNHKLWVYAAQDVPPTHRTSWAAKKLIRFPLDTPSQIETVWDQTEISPDNTQLSADGHRASGQAPWPHGGQYLFAPQSNSFMPTVTGCWSGMAPDNSYLSWMLDGNHRMVTLFTSSPEARTWTLKFSEIAGLEKGEIYHPRWSNHAQFVALTGPYIAEHGGEGSIISKGGRTAEVVIAKLNASVTGFDGSVTLTQNQNTDAYPDVWIANGESALLSNFPQGIAASKSTQAWPTDTTHLAFLWEAVGKPNQISLPDSKNIECYVEPEGTALFGPRLDMQLASGTFRPNALAQAQITKALANAPSWTLEATLLPPSLPHTRSPLSGSLMSLPGRQITLDNGRLTINGTGLDHPSLDLPCYLALRQDGALLTLFVNGTALPTITIPALPDATTTQFGGNSLPVGLLGIALHTIALPDSAIQSSHRLWQPRITKALSQTPPRVRLRAKLVEATGVPTPEGIDPYTRAMIACIYDVEQVLEGTYEPKQILVCHWALMDRKPCSGFPRKPGDSFELLVEPLDLTLHHPELEGQRVLDDTTAFDLEKWYDIAPPKL